MFKLHSMKRSAVVFGASGLVGKTLLKELFHDSSYEKVIAVVRKELPLRNEKFEQVIMTSFANLADHKRKLPATDYFCCIGTTIKKAGSQKAFRDVDHGIPVKIAMFAEELTVPNMVVVSSIGASALSRNFYLRTKGEMEEAVRKIYTGNLTFVRPSLLMGDREEPRFGERMAVGMMKSFGWMFAGPLKKYRGIPAETVVRSMIKAAQYPGNLYLESDKLL